MFSLQFVDGSRDVLVKFDKQYPYGQCFSLRLSCSDTLFSFFFFCFVCFPGEKEDEFKKFAQKVAPSRLWVTEVGVQDYGEHENKPLADRFGINKVKKKSMNKIFMKRCNAGGDDSLQF